MKNNKHKIITTGIWITFSEFLRNEILFKNIWVLHYQKLGLKFETLPLNGILWTIWSFLLAYLLFELLKKNSAGKVFIVVWIMAFLMMWITLFNLQALPIGLLLPAIPLSALEIYVAIKILDVKPKVI